MIPVDPVCAGCYGPMRTVPVHHANGRTTVHQLCPECLTGRSIDDTELHHPAAVGETPTRGRHLHAVPTSGESE
jgi:hypothetical protein